MESRAARDGADDQTDAEQGHHGLTGTRLRSRRSTLVVSAIALGVAAIAGAGLALMPSAPAPKTSLSEAPAPAQSNARPPVGESDGVSRDVNVPVLKDGPDPDHAQVGRPDVDVTGSSAKPSAPFEVQRPGDDFDAGRAPGRSAVPGRPGGRRLDRFSGAAPRSRRERSGQADRYASRDDAPRFSRTDNSDQGAKAARQRGEDGWRRGGLRKAADEAGRRQGAGAKDRRKGREGEGGSSGRDSVSAASAGAAEEGGRGGDRGGDACPSRRGADCAGAAGLVRRAVCRSDHARVRLPDAFAGGAHPQLRRSKSRSEVGKRRRPSSRSRHEEPNV